MIGNSSNVWKAGGDGTTHSIVGDPLVALGNSLFSTNNQGLAAFTAVPVKVT